MAKGDVISEDEVSGPPSATSGQVIPESEIQQPGDGPDVGYGTAIASALTRGFPAAERLRLRLKPICRARFLARPPEASDDYQKNYVRIGKTMEAAQKQYPKTSFAAAAVPQMIGAAIAPESAGGSLLRTGLSNFGWGAATAANEGDQPLSAGDVASRGLWGGALGASAGTAMSGLGSLLLPYGAAGRDALVAAANRAGVDVPRYIASVSPFMQRMGQLARSVPLVGEKVAESTGEMVKQMGESAENTAAGVTPVAAGSRAKEALVNWIGPQTDATLNNAYGNASRLMNNTVKTPLTNTSSMLSTLAQQSGTYGSELGGQAVKLIQQAQNMPGGLTYEGIKNLRTKIGQMGSFGTLLPSELPDVEVKRLYGALSQDLDAAALNSGGPAAQAAHQNANASLNRLLINVSN